MMVARSVFERRRFCSRSCLAHSKIERLNATRRKAKSNSAWFQKGNTPWTKGKRGLRTSPATEFKPGERPNNWTPVGTERMRTDKNGKPRVHVKTAEPNVWRMRSVLTWEATHGPAPRGFLVHHRDRDTLNDRIENLCLLDRSQHLMEHRQEFEDRRKSAAAAALQRLHAQATGMLPRDACGLFGGTED